MIEPATLTIVIPTHNRAGTVGGAVQSVLQNKRPDIELIVVDDRSTDDTAARLATLRDARLRTAKTTGSGGANQARNIGAAMSRAPLLAFLDSDDVFEPGRIDRLISFFRARPDVDCVMDSYVSVSSRRREIHRLPEVTPDCAQLRRMLYAQVLPVTNSAISVRKTAFSSVGGFNEHLWRHQDYDLLLRLAAACRVHFGDGADVVKFRTSGSLSDREYIRGLDDLVRFHQDLLTPEYADLLHYMAARGVVKALCNGSIGVAADELRKWSDAKHLPTDILYSFSRYFAGRKVRKILSQ